MRRRDFIKVIAGSVAAWPLAARAQQRTMPVVGLLYAGPEALDFAAAFRQGLEETGFVEGQMSRSNTVGPTLNTINCPGWRLN